MIEEAFREVLDGYLKSNHRKKVEIIERAYHFAKEAHKGIRRRSGEPYILHPIAVAKIASQEIGLGSTSICAALLHDVVEDTEYTVEDIEQHFGKKIAQLVEGLTKISGGIFGDKASLQAENFRKLLLTMSEDIRVVLIKMADRLHNMRTLGSMAPNKTRLPERHFISMLRLPIVSAFSRSRPNSRISASNMNTLRPMRASPSRSGRARRDARLSTAIFRPRSKRNLTAWVMSMRLRRV